MHIHIIPTKLGGKAYQSVLLRESYRENGRVKKRTLANLGHLPEELIELIRGHLKGKKYIDAESTFEIIKSRQHGAVQAVGTAFKQLDLMRLLAAKACRERSLVGAMIAARIIRPKTKLATVRWWQDTTIVDEFNVHDATVDELYGAMDWLVQRQNRIEAKLGRRHLASGDLVLYDLTSTYVEGRCCKLAQRGYSRDGKRAKLQICFGLLCDVRGCPVAVSVHRGNIRDHETLLGEIKRLQRRFGLKRLVIVGDRGMITQSRIEVLNTSAGIKWITALRSSTIAKLVRAGSVAASDFDEKNLFEVLHPDFPNERLIACRNPRVAAHRAQKRQALLSATEEELEKLAQRVEKGTLKGTAAIGVALGQCINRYRMKKHFGYAITDDSLSYFRRTEKIEHEAALDGIYIIRTSLDADELAAAECVRSYKNLSRVERAFRTLKSISLKVRPIHHHLSDRVRAHIFLCTLAYYVEWHMREAWREVLFADPELEQLARSRDPVAPAERSEQAKRKISSQKLQDGSTVYCFATLMEHLQTITRNRCRSRFLSSNNEDAKETSFEITATPNEKQQQVLQLLENIKTML